MQDSRLAELRPDGSTSGHWPQVGWGDLPPKERDQALQAIGRDYPAHYRDLIEQYFRELAAESTPPALKTMLRQRGSETSASGIVWNRTPPRLSAYFLVLAILLSAAAVESGDAMLTLLDADRRQA
jgi:hypothetical protein